MEEGYFLLQWVHTYLCLESWPPGRAQTESRPVGSRPSDAIIFFQTHPKGKKGGGEKSLPVSPFN